MILAVQFGRQGSCVTSKLAKISKTIATTATKVLLVEYIVLGHALASGDFWGVAGSRDFLVGC